MSEPIDKQALAELAACIDAQGSARQTALNVLRHAFHDVLTSKRDGYSAARRHAQFTTAFESLHALMVEMDGRATSPGED